MATLADVRTLARQRADMEGSSFVSDAELNSYINASFAELYDLLTSRFEDYYSSSLTFTLAGSVSSYALPADFYKLRGLDFQYTAPNEWISVRQFNFAERNSLSRNLSRLTYGVRDVSYRVMGNQILFLPEGSAQGTYRLWYIPRFTPLASDTDVLAGILDFEEYIVVDAAIKCLIKEESDTSMLMAMKEQLKARILAMSANRDANEPERVADTNRRGYDFDYLFPRS